MSEVTDPSEAVDAKEDLPESWRSYPGARAPDRSRDLDACGVRLRVIEWGEHDAPVLLLAHGGADFARTFDVFAPLLADAGYRVVSWDHRGHGDSGRPALMSWEADRRDARLVLEDALADRPADERAFAVGHSKGGGLTTDLCAALPQLFHCLVNIDGVPSRRRHELEASEEPSLEERVDRRRRWLGSFLDFRGLPATTERRPGTPQELMERRAKHNPRLDHEWLRYLVTVGARGDADGWRWKLDPTVRMFQPGPWRPHWGIRSLRSVRVPMLAILGAVQEPMGWGTRAEEARRNLPDHAEMTVWEDSGHFVHIEHPQRTADRVIEFLARHRPTTGTAAGASTEPPATEPDETAEEPPRRDSGTGAVAFQQTRTLDHGRLRFALHQLARTTAGGDPPPLLCLHDLGGSGRDFARLAEKGAWPGAVWAPDLSGHGASPDAPGGGYSSEYLLAEVDAALDVLGPSVVLGRGWGAYLALLAAGFRPEKVRACVLADGRGALGGGVEPQVPVRIPIPRSGRRPADACDACDPMAWSELQREIRPPGYAAVTVRQVVHATEHAGLERAPIWCCGFDPEPPWLEPVREEGRSAGGVEEALERVRGVVG